MTMLTLTKKANKGHDMAMGIMFKSAGMCLGVGIGTAVFTTLMGSRREGR